jgi:hypothetical protein
VDDHGKTERVLGSAGANNRRTMIRVLREELKIDHAIQKATEAKKAEAKQKESVSA